MSANDLEMARRALRTTDKYQHPAQAPTAQALVAEAMAWVAIHRAETNQSVGERDA